MTPGQFLTDFHEVGALVAVLRQRHVRPAECLRVPREYGAVEQLHLVARVVHVVLAGDVESGSCERTREPAAEHSAAGVAYVHRAGGVHAHELDLHPPTLADLHVAERLACGADRLHLRAQPVIAQVEVHEPRRSGGDLADGVSVFSIPHESVRECLRNLQRRALGSLGDAQGKAGGEVAVAGLLWTLHDSRLRQVERG